MLAEKYAYLEETAPALETQQRELRPVRQSEPRQKEQPRRAPVRRFLTLNRIATVGLVLICFAAASFTVFRYTMISNHHRTILELENQLEQEILQKSKLEVELSHRKDLNSIEFSATEMGMKYPEEGQVQYVELPQQQKQVEQADASPAQSNQSLLSRFLGLSN